MLKASLSDRSRFNFHRTYATLPLLVPANTIARTAASGDRSVAASPIASRCRNSHPNSNPASFPPGDSRDSRDKTAKSAAAPLPTATRSTHRTAASDCQCCPPRYGDRSSHRADVRHRWVYTADSICHIAIAKAVRTNFGRGEWHSPGFRSIGLS